MLVTFEVLHLLARAIGEMNHVTFLLIWMEVSSC
jgi:hypothetical protein